MPIPRVDATESTLMTPCATDLKGVGVEFRLIENKIFTWNLSPEMDIIEISLARLNSNSNSFYRNLIIFEQYFFKVVRSKVMTYAMFMSCLIGSEADLTNILNQRGDHELCNKEDRQSRYDQSSFGIMAESPRHTVTDHRKIPLVIDRDSEMTQRAGTRHRLDFV